MREPQTDGFWGDKQAVKCRALVMPIDIEGDANLKNAFPCACQIYTPPQTIAADGGQRGKKRFVAPAKITHTLASRTATFFFGKPALDRIAMPVHETSCL